MSTPRNESQSLRARLSRCKFKSNQTVSRLSDAPDPFQRKAFFQPAEKCGCFHVCGNGYRSKKVLI